MKNNFTAGTITSRKAHLFSGLILIISAFIFYSCASTSEESIKNSNLDNDAVKSNSKSFSFYEQNEGENNYWKVVFKDDTISSAYLNGKEIPPDQIDKYKDLIYDNIGEISRPHKMYLSKDFHFKFDGDKLKKDLKKMKENLKCMHFQFNDSVFSSDKFQHEMENMACNLDKLKDINIKIHFDSDKFKNEMNELKKDLEEHKIDIKIDLSDLKEKMKDLKIKLKGLDIKLDKLKSFMKDLRKELVKDGYIKTEDEDFDMKLNSDEMTINGKKLPDNIYEKYKKMYKDHFGKDLKEGKDFIIH